MVFSNDSFFVLLGLETAFFLGVNGAAAFAEIFHILKTGARLVYILELDRVE